MKTLYLIRGVPGAGKSTFASVLAEALDMPEEGVHAGTYEADMFMGPVFDGSRLKECHAACLTTAIADMEYGIEHIIVSNTFTQQWEMQQYEEAARANNYRIVRLIVENPEGRSSVHDVPEATLAKMRDRFEIAL